MSRPTLFHFVCPHEDVMLQKGLIIINQLFADLFQQEIPFAGELCVVFNDPNGGFPLFTKETPMGIRLCIDNPFDICSLIRQLAHECTHYVFHSYKQEKNKHAARYEEIFAEAIALYALKQAPNYIVQLNVDFDIVQTQQLPLCFERIYQMYVKNQMPVKQEVSPLRWRMLESHATRLRERHYQEVLLVYEALMSQTLDVHLIFDYTPYLQKNKQIDFGKWREKHPSLTLDLLQQLQPKIKE